MYRTICVGLMALPIYLYNADSDLPPFKPMFSMTITQILPSSNTRLYKIQHKILGRDDQSEDCLRLGTCKD